MEPSVHKLLADSSGLLLILALAILAALTVLGVSALEVGAKIVFRFLRSRDIRDQGWPPPHCDADGDPIKNEEDDQ